MPMVVVMFRSAGTSRHTLNSRTMSTIITVAERVRINSCEWCRERERKGGGVKSAWEK